MEHTYDRLTKTQNITRILGIEGRMEAEGIIISYIYKVATESESLGLSNEMVDKFRQSPSPNVLIPLRDDHHANIPLRRILLQDEYSKIPVYNLYQRQRDWANYALDMLISKKFNLLGLVVKIVKRENGIKGLETLFRPIFEIIHMQNEKIL